MSEGQIGFRLVPAQTHLQALAVLPESQLTELKRFAEHLADLAGEVIRSSWAKPKLEVEIKSDGSPVTLADKEAERVMRAAIKRTYPDHGIVGEEFGSEHETREFCWVLDPIDGTKSFISRVPLFTTLVGLRYQQAPLVGLIDQPLLRERAVGDGRTATFNGQPTRAVESSLVQAVVLTTDVENIYRHHPRADWQGLTAKANFCRTWGDGYGHLMVAAGRAHVMADPIMNPWDLIPVIPVLRGAGAVVTAWDGSEAMAAGNALVAAPRLHAEVLACLRR